MSPSIDYYIQQLCSWDDFKKESIITCYDVHSYEKGATLSFDTFPCFKNKGSFA